jgi:hypothetical protein
MKIADVVGSIPTTTFDAEMNMPSEMRRCGPRDRRAIAPT